MELQTSTDNRADPRIQRTNSSSSQETIQSSPIPEEDHPNKEDGSPGRVDDVEKQQSTNPSQADSVTKRPDLVEFDGPDDPDNPKNWTKRKRWSITVSGALLTFTVTFSSSIFSVAINPVAEEYNIGTVVSTLGVSLFLLGFVFGPILFGPASEAFGRKLPLFAGYAVFAIFQIPVAVAQNVETIMLGRFLGGFAASSPLAVVGGLLADMWEPIDRAYAIACFACGGFAGPVA